MDDDSIDKIINMNLTSMMIGTRFLLRQGYFGRVRRSIRADDEAEESVASPVIINVASLLGLQGGYGAVAYAASKAGVLGFTRALATEYASHRVRVNAVVPGYVETEMTKGTRSIVIKYRLSDPLMMNDNRSKHFRVKAKNPARTIRPARGNCTSSLIPSGESICA
ncbi:hypothetical protein N0V83_007206 [Neocucurbitaria cava]|uniref:Uncharacterized protein n=1 Tax=Neocucurbitaria cava TaxID=798079 RepID=A0A9W9CL21_9PLEO|nr:hypothetical protein N0V83_007206 [Neocucurbitaria cava]